VLRGHALRLGSFAVLKGMGGATAWEQTARPEMLLSQSKLSTRTEAAPREEVESFLANPSVASFPANDK
jgi:hypothetical protein